MTLDKLIAKRAAWWVEVCYCHPWRAYNELMAKPARISTALLRWQHATALTSALAKKGRAVGLLDQFSEQPLVQRELAKKG